MNSLAQVRARKTSLGIVVMGALLAASPSVATARERGEAQSSETNSQTITKPKSYCIYFTFTGSRIPQRACKSKDDWLAEGVDVDKPAKS